MADEIAQVCQLEVEGIKMTVKATIQVAAWLFKAFKSFVEACNDAKLSKAGTHSMKDIFKMSKDGPPQTILVDSKYLDEVMSKAKESGLHFFLPPDFNENDGKTPICMPPQDVSLMSSIIKSVTENDIPVYEKEKRNLEQQRDECKEQLLTSSPAERAEIKTKIANIECAIDDLNHVIDDKRNSLDVKPMNIQEYFASGIGTEFERDPDKAISEWKKGVDISPTISAKDCFKVIRHSSLVPDSKIKIIVPMKGGAVDVTREFKTDKDGLVYSEYEFKTDKGEIYSFTDKGMDPASFYRDVLPELYDKSGMLEDTPCRIFQTKEAYVAFKKYYNNVTPQSEISLDKNGELVFSSAEVEKEFRQEAENRLKGLASARIDGQDITISVPEDSLSMRNGFLICEVSGQKYQIKGDINGLKPIKSDDGVLAFKMDKKSVQFSRMDNIDDGLLLKSISADDFLKVVHGARAAAISGLGKGR